MRLESQETETTPGHSSILFEHFFPVGFPLWGLEAIVLLLALSRERHDCAFTEHEVTWGGNRGMGEKSQVPRCSLGVLDATPCRASSTFCGKVC